MNNGVNIMVNILFKYNEKNVKSEIFSEISLPPKFGLNRISYPSSICVNVLVMFSSCAAVNVL